MSAVPKRKRVDDDTRSGESLLKDEVEFSRMDQPFPRGGGSVLAPLDIRKAATEATNDVFDQMVKTKKAKKSKTKQQIAPVSLGTNIEPFLLSKIKIGTLVLGKVIDIKVSTSELIVSLPNQLVGYCEVPKDQLVPSMLQRYLRFAVVELGGNPKKKLQLSYDPELVNQTITTNELTNGLAVQGIVESVEEKGLLVQLGSQLGQGFIPLKTNQTSRFEPQMPVLAFVTESEKRVKSLTLDSNMAVSAVIEQPSLVPGTLVKSCPVERENTMGCIYDLLGHLKATSDAVHSQNPQGKSVRVLFSYPPLQINGERKLGVSKLEHIVKLTDSKEDDVKIGKTLDTRIETVCPNLGVFVQFGSSLQGFVHVSQASFKTAKKSKSSTDEESKVELEGEDYKVGAEHPARILTVSQMDGLAYLSFNRDVIEQQYMSLQEIKIGDVVRNASIDRIMPKGGVLVRLSTSIVGIAQDMQLSDVAMKNPEQKYKVGQKVSCRVLDTDLEHQRVSVSLKKSVVEFDGPILQSFDFPHNEETVATVLRFIDAGALLVFFGNVRGLLPHSEMSESGAKAEDVVRVGQTVRVNIVDSNPQIKRLIASLRPPTQLTPDQIGEVFTAKVSSKNKKEVRVTLYADKNESSELGEAIIVGKAKNFKVGDDLQVKVLTDRLVSADEKIVSNDLPKSVDDLTVGEQVTGYVKGSSPSIGVFIGFAGSLTGLVAANLLDKNVEKWPSTGSAVSVNIDTIDFAKQRVFLSLPSTKSKTISATITAVKEKQLNVITEDGQQGRVDASQCFRSLDEIDDANKPLSEFKRGQKLESLTIIGRHDARNHRFLPLSHQSGTSVMLELSLVHTSSSDANTISKGIKKLGFINNYSEDGQSLYVTLSPTTSGRLSLVDLSDDPEILASPEDHFPVGSALEVTVLTAGAKPTVTALDKPSDIALICAVEPLRLMVRLPFHKTANISCVDSGDEFTELKSTFDIGDLVNYHKRNSKITLRSDPFEPIEEGQIRQGFVSNIADGGVFVALTDTHMGRVKIGEISDNYLKNWKSAVKIGQVVKAKVLSTKNGRIELTLKPSVVTGRKQPQVDHVEIGAKYDGTVVRVESFGVFVEFDNVRGLCHHSEISDHHIDDLSRVFKVGDHVRVKVLSKDVNTGKLSLGMKAEYFESDSESSDNDSDAESSDEATAAADEDDDMYEFPSEDDDGESESESDKEDDDSEVSDSDSADDSGEEDSAEDSRGLSAGFNWSGDLPDVENSPANSDSDEDSESDDDEPRTRRKKKREEFVRDETASLHTRAPESAKEFERLLVASPHSSVLWTQYMAYQLKLGEIDATREVARRALKSIPQRDEEERMNIWLALLNVEVQFGSRESTDRVFSEAQQFMDALTMHLKMAQIYAEAGKLKEARGIYERAIKKFGSDSLDVWLAAMRFFYSTGEDPDAARALSDRAQQRLPSRLVREFTKQFALLEYELGNPERGRTLFEALVDAAPKRVDIWNIYIDQEIKQGDEAKFSALFERALQQRISMKQAKFFFKKWIEVSSDQEYVKSRAREYVEDREAQKNEEEEEEEEEDD